MLTKQRRDEVDPELASLEAVNKDLFRSEEPPNPLSARGYLTWRWMRRRFRLPDGLRRAGDDHAVVRAALTPLLAVLGAVLALVRRPEPRWPEERRWASDVVGRPHVDPALPCAPVGHRTRQRPWFRRVTAAHPAPPEPTAVMEQDPGGPFSVPRHLATPPLDLVSLGAHSFGPPHVEWFPGDTGRLRVGKYCSIQNTAVFFVGGEHRPDWVTTFALREAFGLSGRYASGLPHTRGDVTLGNDVYIGFESLVLSGVTIGDGALVAARSVVTKDIPPYAIVAGTPAKLVRYRFDEEIRAALQRIRWWDWPDETVIARVDELSSPDLSEFVARYDPGD